MYVLSKTKFGIEQSVYCMKLSFDYLIQIACFFLFKDRAMDCLGSFLTALKENQAKAQKLNALIFSRYKDKNYELLKFLNDSANCYKHSYLQAFADSLHGEEVPSVMTVHLKKGNTIAVSNGQYLQLIYAFNVSMAEAMNSIKDFVPDEVRGLIEQRENDPMGFV